MYVRIGSIMFEMNVYIDYFKLIICGYLDQLGQNPFQGFAGELVRDLISEYLKQNSMLAKLDLEPPHSS